ncbi:hypothetical protein COBT_001664 [Conglomerata obtusa]
MILIKGFILMCSMSKNFIYATEKREYSKRTLNFGATIRRCKSSVEGKKNSVMNNKHWKNNKVMLFHYNEHYLDSKSYLFVIPETLKIVISTKQDGLNKKILVRSIIGFVEFEVPSDHYLNELIFIFEAVKQYIHQKFQIIPEHRNILKKNRNVTNVVLLKNYLSSLGNNANDSGAFVDFDLELDYRYKKISTFLKTYYVYELFDNIYSIDNKESIRELDKVYNQYFINYNIDNDKCDDKKKGESVFEIDYEINNQNEETQSYIRVKNVYNHERKFDLIAKSQRNSHLSYSSTPRDSVCSNQSELARNSDSAYGSLCDQSCDAAVLEHINYDNNTYYKAEQSLVEAISTEIFYFIRLDTLYNQLKDYDCLLNTIYQLNTKMNPICIREDFIKLKGSYESMHEFEFFYVKKVIQKSKKNSLIHLQVLNLIRGLFLEEFEDAFVMLGIERDEFLAQKECEKNAIQNEITSKDLLINSYKEIFELIKSENFDEYVAFASNYSSCCKANSNIQNYLGPNYSNLITHINNFFSDPMQRLPKYKLLIDTMVKSCNCEQTKQLGISAANHLKDYCILLNNNIPNISLTQNERFDFAKIYGFTKYMTFDNKLLLYLLDIPNYTIFLFNNSLLVAKRLCNITSMENFYPDDYKIHSYALISNVTISVDSQNKYSLELKFIDITKNKEKFETSNFTFKKTHQSVKFIKWYIITKYRNKCYFEKRISYKNYYFNLFIVNEKNLDCADNFEFNNTLNERMENAESQTTDSDLIGDKFHAIQDIYKNEINSLCDFDMHYCEQIYLKVKNLSNLPEILVHFDDNLNKIFLSNDTNVSIGNLLYSKNDMNELQDNDNVGNKSVFEAVNDCYSTLTKTIFTNKLETIEPSEDSYHDNKNNTHGNSTEINNNFLTYEFNTAEHTTMRRKSYEFSESEESSANGNDTLKLEADKKANVSSENGCIDFIEKERKKIYKLCKEFEKELLKSIAGFKKCINAKPQTLHDCRVSSFDLHQLYIGSDNQPHQFIQTSKKIMEYWKKSIKNYLSVYQMETLRVNIDEIHSADCLLPFGIARRSIIRTIIKHFGNVHRQIALLKLPEILIYLFPNFL